MAYVKRKKLSIYKSISNTYNFTKAVRRIRFQLAQNWIFVLTIHSTVPHDNILFPFEKWKVKYIKNAGSSSFFILNWMSIQATQTWKLYKWTCYCNEVAFNCTKLYYALVSLDITCYYSYILQVTMLMIN